MKSKTTKTLVFIGLGLVTNLIIGNTVYALDNSNIIQNTLDLFNPITGAKRIIDASNESINKIAEGMIKILNIVGGAL